MLANSKAGKHLVKHVPLFAAIGDETRLSLLLQLGAGSLCSITQLSEGRPQTRQAIRKHLQILESVSLVRGVRQGRENLFQLEPKTLEAATQSLEAIARTSMGRPVTPLESVCRGVTAHSLHAASPDSAPAIFHIKLDTSNGSICFTGRVTQRRSAARIRLDDNQRQDERDDM